MKTTIEISDALLRQARKVAARDGVTLSTLVVRGLRCVISEPKAAAAFKLRRAAFEGNGLQSKFRNASSETISAAAYQERTD